MGAHEVDYGCCDSEYGADDDDLLAAEAVCEYASGELEYELGEGLHHEEHADELFGCPEFEDVEASVGYPEHDCGHVECLGQGEDCEVSVGECLADDSECGHVFDLSRGPLLSGSVYHVFRWVVCFIGLGGVWGLGWL